jgi:DNA-3-methyladenine glycosylase II
MDTPSPDLSPAWWPEAQRALAAADPVMAHLLATHGCTHPRARPRGGPFLTLAQSVVSQQLSTKAAATIWARVEAGLGAPLPPAAVVACPLDALRAFGLSARKAEYLQGLAAADLDGRLDAVRWATLSDEALLAELVGLRGIGRWTAQMYLLFGADRPDVFAPDDAGLRRAIGALYCGGAAPDAETLAALSARWAPYRSLAALLLWRSLDG